MISSPAQANAAHNHSHENVPVVLNRAGARDGKLARCGSLSQPQATATSALMISLSRPSDDKLTYPLTLTTFMRSLPFLALFLSSFSLTAAYSPVPRWGQAIAVIGDVLFVFGGKTDPYNTYGYSSAPWNNDLLSLSLSAAFNPSAPPWQYISGSQNTSVSSQGNAVAWHTLSAFNASFFLIFGGNTGPLSSIVLLDNSDSAQLLDVHNPTAPSFLTLPNNWAGEPQRRMRHASASANGKIYIIGGEAADGSGNTLSAHYIFNPSGPAFTQLPTQNSPPGIYGHSAIILFDGRLLVFGGIAGGQLVPFSTIWILDTTQSNLTWTLAFVGGSNLPPPRAAFAVVLLDDGRILVQGGTDAAFQTNLADGWILDPSNSTMTWTAVPALSQVGARRDHFAFNADGQVVFGFGYGDSAPANPSVQVYNVGSSSFQPTFSPMTAPPAHTTLPPDPSHPITNPPRSSQTHTNGSPSGQSSLGRSGQGGSTSSNTGRPSSTSTGGGGGGGGGPGNNGNPFGGSGKNKAAIAIGTVLGVLGFATGVAFVLWYLRRRHVRSGHAFDPLGDDEGDSPHSITAVRLGGTREKGPRILAVPLGLLGMIGLGSSRHANRSRRDILADEDRSFQWISVSRDGSRGRSSFGSRSARSSIRVLSNAITERFASIRNLTRGAGSGSHSREPSKNWEKMGSDPFSPEVALMAEGLTRDHLPEQSRDGSDPTQPYTDPFADQDISWDPLELYGFEPEAGSSHTSEKELATTETKPLNIRTALPPSADFVPLSPLVEQVSQTSLSNSSLSHHTKSDQYNGSGSSQGAVHPPRPSSILDPNPPQSQPIRRTNSWWARFAKAPLLERRGTDSSSRNGGFIDFRDPNPPPRLLTIEESSHSRSPSNGTAEARPRHKPSVGANRARAGTPTRRPSLYHETIHGRSASSLQTANTEILERVGGTMDIVQRDGTLDSHHTSPTGLDDEFGVGGGGGSGSGSGPPLRALLVRGEPSYHSTRTASTSVSASVESPRIQSPLRSAASSPTDGFTHPALSSSAPSEEAAASSVAEHAGSPPRSPGVAERVRAFERRMSRESASPPSPTNTRQREERLMPPPAPLAVTRPAVRYGLVPRPSLFVANPDRGGGSRGGSDGG